MKKIKKKRVSLKDLAEGFTLATTEATLYHFRHVPIEQADELLEQREQTHKVVTVNRTFSADKKHLHVNEYLALSLADAIFIAARLEIQSREVAEEVVAIEPIHPDEELEFLQADQELKGRIHTPVKAI